VKKGRHRRFEEARALKRSIEPVVEPCAECGAMPGADHASWCLAMEDEELPMEDDGEELVPGFADEAEARRAP
jgi:hypothetical protein